MLELRGLKKRYGEVVALDGCSFRAEPGRILGFLGRNGAGKTTTMRGIFGLIQLDAGAVYWQDRPVTRQDRFQFGYMPEERGLYPAMPIREQLRYFGRLRRLSVKAAGVEADRWLERLDLAERGDMPLESLSHGNQQRIQLAVSLIGSPRLLVLDEPFSGLDPIAAETLSSVIREEAQHGTAIVFSSHQLDLVGDVCDDIAIITAGRVVLTGDLDSVRRSSLHRFVSVGYDRPVTRPAMFEASLPGLEVESWSQDEIRLRLPRETSPEDALATLSGLGRIETFRFEPPSLEDIFREVAGGA
jgi:ABC-2 type transport system ATP-binding protein